MKLVVETLTLETGEGLLVFEMTAEMVEAVYTEYRTQNPGRTERDMSPADFAAKMMVKVKANARLVPRVNP